MDSSLILSNALSTPVLFSSTGLTAILHQLDLAIPPPIPQLVSFSSHLIRTAKVEHSTHHSSLKVRASLSLITAVFAIVVVSIYSFFSLWLQLNLYNTAAIVMADGLFGAVTFVTVLVFLSQVNVDFGKLVIASFALRDH
ncbi:MAG: sodium-dependent bicarbonate transport family permease [Leptolyngbyaceae cyanobacterium MAG.088]|nr:sodium-dependent bicarbonate transport family permease [Leptolyngbyaceae cyanobacterium MAG.088]